MMSVQIAIIGIVVVVGLFVLWRRIARLEERLDALQVQRAMSPPEPAHWSKDGDADEHAAHAGAYGGGYNGGYNHDGDGDGEDSDDHANHADALMAAIFDLPVDGLGIMEVPVTPGMTGVADVTEIEAEPSPEPAIVPATAPAPAMPPAPADNHAPMDADAESHALSKSKLRKLSVDALKDMLHERGLPTDGNKNVLVDRLYAAIAEA